METSDLTCWQVRAGNAGRSGQVTCPAQGVQVQVMAGQVMSRFQVWLGSPLSSKAQNKALLVLLNVLAQKHGQCLTLLAGCLKIVLHCVQITCHYLPLPANYLTCSLPAQYLQQLKKQVTCPAQGVQVHVQSIVETLCVGIRIQSLIQHELNPNPVKPIRFSSTPASGIQSASRESRSWKTVQTILNRC